jgi:hypothetical protein
MNRSAAGDSPFRPAVACGLPLNSIPLKFGETICFITRSVSEETQERRVFLAYASGYEERMHAWQPNFNGITVKLGWQV